MASTGMDGELLGSTVGLLLWWAWLTLMDKPLAGLRPVVGLTRAWQGAGLVRYSLLLGQAL